MKKIAFIGILFAYINYHMYGIFTQDESMKFATISIIALGFLFGIFQLKANHDWNRRSTALLETEKNKDKYLEALSYLYSLDSLDIEHRKDAYSVNEIHQAICELKEDGKTLKPKNRDTDEYDMTDTGKAIKKHLFDVFNYYEFLSTGVNNGVFDEKIVKDLQKSIMIRFYDLFKDYIIHHRNNHSKGAEIMKQYFLMIERWKHQDVSLFQKLKNFKNKLTRGNVDI